MREIDYERLFARLSWRNLEIYPEDELLGDFLEISVDGRFLAIIARYQRGPFEGLWIAVDNRAHRIPTYISGKVFNDAELRKRLLRYAVQEGLIDGEDE